MGSPLADVVLGVVAFVAVLAVFGLLGSGKLYGRIGAGGTSIEGGEPPGSSQASARERDLEIRQMLLARSERLERSGLPPLDIEREAARLQDPSASLAPVAGARAGAPLHRHDPELVEELRQLIGARNERRRRRGEQLLDVDAEVARKLAELDG